MPSYMGSFAEGFINAFLRARQLHMMQAYFQSRLEYNRFIMERAGYNPDTHMWYNPTTGTYNSNHFIDPTEDAVKSAVSKARGEAGTFGKGMGGVQLNMDKGPFLNHLIGFESSGENVTNKEETSSGKAGGFYQITSGTWRDFAPSNVLAKYPLATDAPFDVQHKVAMNIPYSRYDPKTIAKMEEAGFHVPPNDRNLTLGELAKKFNPEYEKAIYPSTEEVGAPAQLQGAPVKPFSRKDLDTGKYDAPGTTYSTSTTEGGFTPYHVAGAMQPPPQSDHPPITFFNGEVQDSQFPQRPPTIAEQQQPYQVPMHVAPNAPPEEQSYWAQRAAAINGMSGRPDMPYGEHSGYPETPYGSHSGYAPGQADSPISPSYPAGTGAAQGPPILPQSANTTNISPGTYGPATPGVTPPQQQQSATPQSTSGGPLVKSVPLPPVMPSTWEQNRQAAATDISKNTSQQSSPVVTQAPSLYHYVPTTGIARGQGTAVYAPPNWTSDNPPLRPRPNAADQTKNTQQTTKVQPPIVQPRQQQQPSPNISDSPNVSQPGQTPNSQPIIPPNASAQYASNEPYSGANMDDYMAMNAMNNMDGGQPPVFMAVGGAVPPGGFAGISSTILPQPSTPTPIPPQTAPATPAPIINNITAAPSQPTTPYNLPMETIHGLVNPAQPSNLVNPSSPPYYPSGHFGYQEGGMVGAEDAPNLGPPNIQPDTSAPATEEGAKMLGQMAGRGAAGGAMGGMGMGGMGMGGFNRFKSMNQPTAAATPSNPISQMQSSFSNFRQSLMNSWPSIFTGPNTAGPTSSGPSPPQTSSGMPPAVGQQPQQQQTGYAAGGGVGEDDNSMMTTPEQMDYQMGTYGGPEPISPDMGGGEQPEQVAYGYGAPMMHTPHIYTPGMGRMPSMRMPSMGGSMGMGGMGRMGYGPTPRVSSGRGQTPDIGQGYVGRTEEDQPPGGNVIPLGTAQVSDRNGNPSTGLVNGLSMGLQEGLRQLFGFQNSPVPSQEQNQAKEDFATGKAAFNEKEMNGIRHVVDPEQVMTEHFQNMAGLEAGTEYYLANGNPEAASKFAYSLIQYTKLAAARDGGAALKELYSGNYDKAAQHLVDGYNKIPDGLMADVIKNDDEGNYTVQQKDLHGHIVRQFNVGPKEMLAGALGMHTGMATWQALAETASRYDPTPLRQLQAQQQQYDPYANAGGGATQGVMPVQGGPSTLPSAAPTPASPIPSSPAPTTTPQTTTPAGGRGEAQPPQNVQAASDVQDAAGPEPVYQDPTEELTRMEQQVRQQYRSQVAPPQGAAATPQNLRTYHSALMEADRAASAEIASRTRDITMAAQQHHQDLMMRWQAAKQQQAQSHSDYAAQQRQEHSDIAASTRQQAQDTEAMRREQAQRETPLNSNEPIEGPGETRTTLAAASSQAVMNSFAPIDPNVSQTNSDADQQKRFRAMIPSDQNQHAVGFAATDIARYNRYDPTMAADLTHTLVTSKGFKQDNWKQVKGAAGDTRIQVTLPGLDSFVMSPMGFRQAMNARAEFGTTQQKANTPIPSLKEPTPPNHPITQRVIPSGPGIFGQQPIRPSRAQPAIPNLPISGPPPDYKSLGINPFTGRPAGQ